MLSRLRFAGQCHTIVQLLACVMSSVPPDALAKLQAWCDEKFHNPGTIVFVQDWWTNDGGPIRTKEPKESSIESFRKELEVKNGLQHRLELSIINI